MVMAKCISIGRTGQGATTPNDIGVWWAYGTVYLETDDSSHMSLFASGLKGLGLDVRGRKFRQELRKQLGDDFRNWEQDTDDEWLSVEEHPGPRRPKRFGRRSWTRAFVALVTTQLERVVPLADVADAALRSAKGPRLATGSLAFNGYRDE